MRIFSIVGQLVGQEFNDLLKKALEGEVVIAQVVGRLVRRSGWHSGNNPGPNRLCLNRYRAGYEHEMEKLV